MSLITLTRGSSTGGIALPSACAPGAGGSGCGSTPLTNAISGGKATETGTGPTSNGIVNGKATDQ